MKMSQVFMFAGIAIVSLIVLMAILTILSNISSSTKSSSDDVETEKASIFDITTPTPNQAPTNTGQDTEDGSPVVQDREAIVNDPLEFIELGKNSENNYLDEDNYYTDYDEESISCSVKINMINSDRVSINLKSISNQGKITKMQVWTTSHRNSDWIDYKTLYSIEDFDSSNDEVFARFRDDEGNVSDICSVDI